MRNLFSFFQTKKIVSVSESAKREICDERYRTFKSLGNKHWLCIAVMSIVLSYKLSLWWPVVQLQGHTPKRGIHGATTG